MPWISRMRWRLLESTVVAIHMRLREMEARLMASISDLRDEVRELTTTVDSLDTFLLKFGDRLKNAQQNEDPSVLNGLINELRNNRQRIVADILANTPEETAPKDEEPGPNTPETNQP